MEINKKNIPEENIINSDHEDIFLSDALRSYKYFKAEAAKLRDDNRDATMCEQYAEAHRLLLNRFTYIEPIETTD